MNPASISNMLPKDIPLEIARRQEQRRRKAKREEMHAAIIESAVLLLIAALYCFALRAFIK